MNDQYSLAVDTGGTFTDFVLVGGPDNEVRTLKTPSTPSDFSLGFLAGIQKLGVPFSQLRYIFHGTTMGINSIIQRESGPSVALLTTRGFEDVVEIGWMNKTEMYNLHYQKPVPLVPRRYRIGIDERVGPNGELEKPVDTAELSTVMEWLQREGISGLAISTLNSYRNAENEQAIAAFVRHQYPDLYVSVSTDIVNQRREYERSSTAILNAYLMPSFTEYLTRLSGLLLRDGFAGDMYLMKSNGGVMPLDVAMTFPIHTLLSGPVGGSIACQALSRELQLPNLIGFDMGGTSTDISLVLNGEPQMTDGDIVHGYPIMSAAVDIGYIGAGGGSQATIEGDKTLSVGPKSSGAEPGPVAYGRGGTVPCVTDANVSLGRLGAQLLVADELSLDAVAARGAIQRQIAEPLGLELERASDGILQISEVKMAYAIRAATVDKGLDPRDFALVAFGGAGPMHAVKMAELVGIQRVIVPFSPGTFSAWGMLNTELRHDVVKTIDYAGASINIDNLESVFADLESEGGGFLAKQGIDTKHIAFRRSVDARYKGQEHTLNVAFEGGEVTQGSIARFLEAFHNYHLKRFAHNNRAASVEFVHVRVASLGRLPQETPRPKFSSSGHERGTTRDHRKVWFEGEWRDTRIVSRDHSEVGDVIVGPAIILESGCTTVVPPAYTATVDAQRNLIIEAGGQ